MNPLNSTLPQERALQELHDSYCRITGRTEKYILSQRDWYEWAKYFTRADLETVLLYVLKINANRLRQYRINLALTELLEPTHFDSLRSDAESDRKRLAALARKVQPSQGQVEVARMRHEDVPEPTQPEKRVSDLALIQMLRKSAE